MLRHRSMTHDKGPPSEVYTVEQLGPSRYWTPEGFLYCKDVAIARTGEMLYGPGEVPVSPGSDGVVHIERNEKELLSDTTVSSFNGKSVVNDHPEQQVDAQTWRALSVGVILNPRPDHMDGVGIIRADLLITEPSAQRDVLDRDKREVSCGYDADYEETRPGWGKQTNIIGNHVALVDRGRCGPRCSIGDQQTLGKELDPMATQKAGGTRRAKLAARIRNAFRDAEAAALEEMTDPSMLEEDGEPDGDEGATHVHVHLNGSGGAAGAGGGTPAGGGQDADPADLGGDGDPGAGDPAAGGDPTEKRLANLEAAVAQIVDMLKGQQGGGEAPPPNAPPAGETKGDAETVMDPDEAPADDPKKQFTGDSAALANTYSEVVAMAEILVPGFRLPTFDAAKPRKATVDSLCALRRQVLGHLAMTADGAALINSVSSTPGATFDAAAMDCAKTAMVYRAAAGAKRMMNASKTGFQGTKDNALQPGVNGIPVFGMQGQPARTAGRSVADLQKQFDALYGKQGHA